MSTTHEPEVEVLEVAPSLDRLESQTRGEIDIQIATARRYPRSIKVFRDTALQAATLDEETAASCFYAMPRGGKTVEGPSARLAEIVASCWGHLRIDARGVGEDTRFVTSRAVAWDVQNNVAVGFEVRRRITEKSGKTYNDDMIGVTSNAASSIALRNAVFKVVPSPFWRPIYLACRKVAVGNADTLSKRRATAIAKFAQMGVTAAMIFALLDVKGEEDITLEHLATLIGVFTAIRDGDTTVDEAFAGQAKTSADPVPTVEQFVSSLPPEDAAAAAEKIHGLKLTPAQWKIAARKYAGKPADFVAEIVTQQTDGPRIPATQATEATPPTVPVASVTTSTITTAQAAEAGAQQVDPPATSAPKPGPRAVPKPAQNTQAVLL